MSADAELDEIFIRYSAERDLLLYARTGERALVWRVYEAFRLAGMTIPVRVLAIFDEWAAEPVPRRAAKTIRAAERILDETGAYTGPTERRLPEPLTAFIHDRGREEARLTGRAMVRVYGPAGLGGRGGTVGEGTFRDRRPSAAGLPLRLRC